MISQAYVKEAFDYDPDTGVATWRVRPMHHFNTEHGWRTANGKYAGQPCAHLIGCGYARIKLNGRQYKLHRLVWLWSHGTLPKVIDHINGVKTDTRLCNLRAATTAQNVRNSKKQSGTLSKLKGVTYHHRGGCWQAQIQHNYQYVYLGSFNTEQEAHNAYCEKGRKLFGQFFNPGY